MIVSCFKGVLCQGSMSYPGVGQMRVRNAQAHRCGLSNRALLDHGEGKHEPQPYGRFEAGKFFQCYLKAGASHLSPFKFDPRSVLIVYYLYIGYIY